MNLDLKNFRCFTDKNILFPTSGVSLINAISGCGKSTICNSILYAVTGKLKNISTFGKKSSSVSFEIDNLKITRSRAPNRLTVTDNKTGKIVEDDEAQETIDKLFGKEFANISYIDQDNINSFIFLSPADKMDFLQRLLLNEYNVEGMKEKIRIEINKTKDRILTESSKIDTLTKIIKGFSIGLQPQNVEKTITRKNYLKLMENSKINLEKSETNKQFLINKIKKMEAEFLSNMKKNMIEQTLKELKTQEESLSVKTSKEMITNLESKKKEYLKNKEKIQLLERKKELTEKYLAVSSENKNKIKNLKDFDIISDDQTKLVKFKHAIELYQRIYDLDDKLPAEGSEELLEKKIIELCLEQENNRKNLVEKQTLLKDLEQCYECPSCQKILKLKKDKLVVFENISTSDNQYIKEEILGLKKNIEKNDKKIPELQREQVIFSKINAEYNSLMDRLDELSDGLSMDELKNKLELAEKHKETLQKIKAIEEDSLERQLRRDITKFEGIVEDEDDQNITEEEFFKLTEELAILKDAFNRLTELIEKINELTLLSATYDAYEDCVTETQIQVEKERLVVWEEKVENHKKNISKFEEFSLWVKEVEKSEKIQKDIDDSISLRDSQNDRMKALIKLRDHIKNAERRSVMEFIDSLNSHASIYLENFFPESDIVVSLRTISESKTGKEKIALNFEVNYKGMVDCDISCLSGGERDRINLAFTLALSEIVDSRILMIDEAISSLDIESSNRVVETLRERYKGRLVLLISHQIGTGGFDHVLNL
jgi:DNA repair exonuclease SbcCD ATPase subunit